MRDPIGEAHLAAVRSWRHFDADWYLREYADVAMLDLDPAYHYLWLGAKMGRRPSAGFDRFPSLDLGLEELVNELILDPHFDAVEGYKPTAEFVGPGGIDPSIVAGACVAVHAHMYYADLVDEFVTHLNLVPCRFDLFVSVSNENDQRSIAEAFESIGRLGELHVRVVPNIGRDIAPFLVEFGREMAAYDIVAHIQTKKSLYNAGSTDGWRSSVLQALFENPSRIALYIRALQTGRYGTIYPQCFHAVPYMANTWLANAGLAYSWASRFGVNTLPNGYFDFPVGSMFWARTDAIRPLLEGGLTWSDFPAESGQTDGTLAHCVERMLGVVPSSRRYMHGVIRDDRAPSWSRWRINQFIDRPLKDIHDAINAPDIRVIAFDIFDTLLVRPFLDPDHVKTILDAECERAGAGGFRQARMAGEQSARAAMDRDVDLGEIYRAIAKGRRDSFSPEREVELETLSVRPRREVCDLLRFALRSGKAVILASDMFLPRAAIEDMLGRCGIAGWDRLYLSSEVGVRKDSGKLYDHILAAERIDASRMLMIGDNERSDFQIPADMGIRTVHVVKPQNIIRAMPRWEGLIPGAEDAPTRDQFLFGAIATEVFGGITYPGFSPDDMFGASPRDLGYGLLGPIVVAFSQWLLAEAHKHDIRRLYFLAREGKFLLTAFDHWQSALRKFYRDDPVSVDGRYLLISRRAITVPSLKDERDIFKIAEANDFYDAPMAMLLEERFGVVLSDQRWSECERLGLWRRSQPLTISGGDINHIRPFLREIAADILDQADTERTSACEYYRAMGLNDDERCAVVDIGYGATIQRHLSSLLGKDVDGLYMMTDQKGRALGERSNMLVGGCFVEGAERRRTASPMFVHSFFLEKMLSADDEQVIHYSPGGGAVFRESAADDDAGRELRGQIQAGALAFVEDAARFKTEMTSVFAIDKAACERLFSRFVANMSERERAMFSHLALDDFYCGRGMV